MKVAIFTPRSITPLHPRLLVFKDFFDNLRVPIAIYNFNDKASQVPSLRNWLTLWFFDWVAIAHAEKLIDKYDVIIANDLKYLPLVKSAKKKGKRIIYETIDHNVYLRFYQLSNRFPAFKPLYSPVTWVFKKVEKKYAHQYCDEIIVNSDALKKYFDEKATVLYYSSPLETLRLSNNPERKPALLYLGVFTIDKGAQVMLELSERLRLPLFVFGDIPEQSIRELTRKLTHVTHKTKLSIPDLEGALKHLMDSYFLIGMNITEPVHQSYAVQEANKDIDYLALGIPIIGNYRLPTKEKIDKGCGWFYDEKDLLEKISNIIERQTKSQTASDLYQQKYSRAQFNKTLQACWERITSKALL